MLLPYKAWLALFILALPIVLYKGLREPIWCAAFAAYLYFAIPYREFAAGMYPYAVGFWSLGMLVTAIVVRKHALRAARSDIDGASLHAVEAALASARSELANAIIDRSSEKLDRAEESAGTSVDRSSEALQLAERVAYEVVDRASPRRTWGAMRLATHELLERASIAGEREARRILGYAAGATRGNVRAALEDRVPPLIAASLEDETAPRVRSRIQADVEAFESQAARESGPRSIATGPLGIPLYRGPLLALLSNPGLVLFLIFMLLTYAGTESAMFDVKKAAAKFDTEELLLIPMIAIIWCVREPRHLRIFVFGWMAGVVHLCMNAIYYWVHNGGRADDVGGQGGESNFLGAIVMCVAPIAFGMVLNEKSKRMALAGLAFSGIFALGVLASGSRSALIGLLGCSGYWLLHTNRKGIALGVAVFGIAGFLAVARDEFWTRMGTIIGPKDSNPWVKLDDEPSKHEREVLWALALETFEAHPLTGIGPGQFPNLSAEETEFIDAYEGVRGLQAHNMWLQLAAEYGVVGTVVWAGAFLLALACFGAARRRMKGHRGWEWFSAMALGLEAGMVGSAICCTFNSFQWYDYHYWHFVLGPVTYQIAKETADRLEWMKPIHVQEARPPPRYGPPAADRDVEDIDLSSVAPLTIRAASPHYGSTTP